MLPILCRIEHTRPLYWVSNSTRSTEHLVARIAIGRFSLLEAHCIKHLLNCPRIISGSLACCSTRPMPLLEGKGKGPLRKEALVVTPIGYQRDNRLSRDNVSTCVAQGKAALEGALTTKVRQRYS